MPGSRLTRDERVKIETLWGEGQLAPEIADKLGRDRVTVWREIRRNNSYRHGTKNPSRRGAATPGGGTGIYLTGYDAGWAQERADRRARRPRRAACAPGGRARTQVLKKLRLRWSPKQIAGWLRTQYPDRPQLWVSHETIYQAIYVQSRGGLRQELTAQVALRSGRAQRRTQAQTAGASKSKRPWARGFHISTRPAEAEDRAVPGHWEGDLIIGRLSKSAIITLVERSTRYVMLGELPGGRTSLEVVDVLSRLAARLPAHLLRSLTWDCGNEMAQHPRFTVATDCPVFFCDPHTPWQRGSNENTNGLLRQYFPKHTFDFRTVDQEHLDAVAAELNGRPRQTLGFATPAERLAALVAPAA